MTEVPDKLTEGTGRGRGRAPAGAGVGPATPSASRRRERRAPRTSTRSRRVEAEPAAVAMATGSGVGLVALPGEKLSKAAMARLEAAAVTPDDDETRDGPDEPLDANGDEPRRRRRRGGRGRGRGRGRTEGGELERSPVAADGDRPVDADDVDIDIDEVEQAEARSRPPEVESTAPRGPRPGAFGSVWDSQIGQTRTPSSVESTPFDLGPDEDEPAIPEYLIAEQRRANSSGRGGRPAGRGGRGGGYSAAVDPRYGVAAVVAGSPLSDVSGPRRQCPAGRPRRSAGRPWTGNRPDRDRGVPSGRSDEPWVSPPEMEAMLARSWPNAATTDRHRPPFVR